MITVAITAIVVAAAILSVLSYRRMRRALTEFEREQRDRNHNI